jgi:hypothetical protein
MRQGDDLGRGGDAKRAEIMLTGHQAARHLVTSRDATKIVYETWGQGRP